MPTFNVRDFTISGRWLVSEASTLDIAELPQTITVVGRTEQRFTFATPRYDGNGEDIVAYIYDAENADLKARGIEVHILNT